MNLLSSANRKAIIEQLDNQHFDLAVIGGGITGAGIALDAASRGLKVALIEKNDFASGTSSRSTKLIHGGLRYLKQLEIGLVREVGQERAIVHQLAPHLVIAEKMLLPLIEGGTLGKIGTNLALMVYDFLAGVESEDKRKMLSAEETKTLEPLLRDDILKGGGFYAEYRTDDARLTIEIIKKAAEYGAISLNYVKAENFLYDESQKVKGLSCLDMDNGERFNIHCDYVVSAAGPWVDKIRKVDQSLTGKHLFLTKGVHLVVPHERLPLRQSVYFDVPDGRMIFAIPRHKITYIGTTDTPYDGDINHILTNQEDADYLLKAVNNMFPTVQLNNDDVISSWAGLRPLIHEEGKSASELSRKDEIFESPTGLISIAGGKLTGYRKMAERVVDEVAERYEAAGKGQLQACHTNQIDLGGGPFDHGAAVEAYAQQVSQQVQKAGLPESTARYLVYNYGKQSAQILEDLRSYPDDVVVALARAELKFCIEKELTLKPADFFSRRTGRLYFDIQSIRPVLSAVLDDFQNTFGWTQEQYEQEKSYIEQSMYEAANFEYSKMAKPS
ncbi:MAG: glycerol-3-phosphate dehydrogenase/oxidase [Bacteroidota bacterium]